MSPPSASSLSVSTSCRTEDMKRSVKLPLTPDCRLSLVWRSRKNLRSASLTPPRNQSDTAPST